MAQRWRPLPGEWEDEALAVRIELLVPHVVRFGEAMEELVAHRQAGTSDFAFLRPSGAGHEYYRAQLRQAQNQLRKQAEYVF